MQSNGVQSSHKQHPRQDRQCEGQQTYHTVLIIITNILTKHIPLLHYTKRNWVTSASSTTLPICTTQGGGRGSEQHNHITLLSTAPFQMAAILPQSDPFIANSRSSQESLARTKVWAAVHKDIALMVKVGVWWLKDQWE